MTMTQEHPTVTPFTGYARVASKTLAATGVVVLTLEADPGEALPAWTPGSHIDLHVTDDLVRQYSLCGDVATAEWRVGVLHEPDGRGASDHLHANINAGDRLRVSEPRNNFVLDDAPSYLFIAGGIGVTPLLPMIADAETRGIPWRLVYSGRSLETMAFREELAPFGDRVQLIPRDTADRVDLVALLESTTPGQLIYACGPDTLMAAIAEAAAHWPEGALRTERFHAADIDESANDSFEVELAKAGFRLTIPADRSILSVLEDHEIYVETSCGEGICGSCEVTVLEGEPEHRDSVLSPSERESNESMMVCVSRCRSKLLRLDL